MYMEELSNINCLYIRQFGISVTVGHLDSLVFDRTTFYLFCIFLFL